MVSTTEMCQGTEGVAVSKPSEDPRQGRRVATGGPPAIERGTRASGGGGVDGRPVVIE